MSSLNISRNEIADIFQCLLPKDVAMYLSSYHRHPIDEFIGKDKLKEKQSKLTGRGVCTWWENYEVGVISSARRRRTSVTRRETNYNLSAYSRLRLFYPFTHWKINQYTKQEIKDIAERNGIKLSMSWKKDKMIEEFYKRSN